MYDIYEVFNDGFYSIVVNTNISETNIIKYGSDDE